MKKSWIVGCAPECDVVVADAHVSGRHCQLTETDRGFELLDLGSTHGTYVNGRIVAGPVRVTPKDTILLGRSASMPWPAAAGSISKRSQQPTSTRNNDRVQVKELILGRDPECDLVLDSARVSPRHARVRRIGAQLVVEDLGTVNGTFVNGQRIAGPVMLRVGDLISLSRFKLEVTPEGHLKKRDFPGELTIEVRNVSIDIPGRRLLENVSLTIYPFEFVGLIGPSGAGKTTLMNALNGYSPPSEGLVLFNGQDLYTHYAQFSGAIGYVPQDDIMHRELTVGQALRYTAKLRLPANTTNEELEARVAKVLQQLQLESTVNTLIGSPERKGISGGQRKRVNLAMELLIDPAVLFLDEPTSGLSSEDALMVMILLRELADSGKSILLTIHQPSLEVYQLLDNVAIISRDPQVAEPGRLAYYGPAYPDAVYFFNPERDAAGAPAVEPAPGEVLRGLSKRPTHEWCDRYEASRYKQEYVTARSGKPMSGLTNGQFKPVNCDVLQQWSTLVRRCLAIKVSDRWNTAILLAQAPIVALLIILVFGAQARQKITSENWLQVTGSIAVTVFLLGLSSLWFGCSNAVREIVGEWAVYRRERMVNLQLPSYVMSKLVVGGALCFIQCAVLVLAARWGCGLRAPIVSSFLITMLMAWTGIGVGLIISAVARSQEVAIALLPLVLIPMVIFGGTLLPVYKMQRAIQPLAYIMPSRYGFEALILEEASRKPLGPSPYSTSISSNRGVDDPDRPDIAEIYVPKNARLGITASVAALAVLFGTTLVAALLILRFRDVH